MNNIGLGKRLLEYKYNLNNLNFYITVFLKC